MKLDNKKIYEIYRANEHLNYKDKANICNEYFGTDYDESTFRKRYVSYKDGLHSNFTVDDDLELLARKELDIETKRKKVILQRQLINKTTREYALKDLIEDVIKDIDFPEYDYIPIQNEVKLYTKQPIQQGEWWLLSHADLHYDGNFDLKEHFNRLYNIIIERNLPELYIFGLGDETEGLLRVSAAMDSKLGAVEQMREYAVHYLHFLQKLSQKMILHIYQVQSSNHTQTRILQTGRNEMQQEDLLQFLTAVLSVGLENNPNVDLYFDDELFVNINGFNFYLEHGHNMRKASSYIEKKMADRRIDIDYFYFGHIHHYLNEVLHARKNYDTDYTAVPSCKPTITNYEKNLMLSSNPAVLLEKFGKNGRIITEKIILR